LRKKICPFATVQAVSSFSSSLSAHTGAAVPARHLLVLRRAGSRLASPSCSWRRRNALLLFLRHQSRSTLPLVLPGSNSTAVEQFLRRLNSPQPSSLKPIPLPISFACSLRCSLKHICYCYWLRFAECSIFIMAEPPWPPSSISTWPAVSG